MQMNGTRQLAATPEQAWLALNDPEMLKACIAGCDKFEAVTDFQYVMRVSIRIGPVFAKFTGTVTLDEVVPPSSYVIHFEAQGGVSEFGKGSSKVQLVPNDQGVELQYQVESQVGGKLAQVGERLVDVAAKSLAEDFFKRFEAKLAERLQQASGEGTSAGAGAGDQGSETAGGSTQGDFMNLPRWAGYVVAAVAAGLVIIFTPAS
ncbi:MAG: carbon monoxide dehydrogenase subunit G [Bordetella sp.]|jgi:carbon monoxide dehydrogenase subunit G